MFTVKQIVKDPNERSNRAIRLWEAVSVWLEPKPHLLPELELQVAFHMPDGVLATIDTGVVYVMNDHGKTVESFHLKNSEHL
jgi:hypothetical protein